MYFSGSSYVAKSTNAAVMFEEVALEDIVFNIYCRKKN
jgi:hypothetical protein